MPCESTNRHRLGKTPSFSLPPKLQLGRRALMRRTSILHPFGLLWTSVFLSRTSEIRHRFAPGSPRTLQSFLPKQSQGISLTCPGTLAIRPTDNTSNRPPLEAPRLAKMRPFRPHACVELRRIPGQRALFPAPPPPQIPGRQYSCAPDSWLCGANR